METEIDLEKTKEQELLKEVRRVEKRNKELMDQVGDEQSKLIALTDAYDKLQEKMRKYKGQIEGAEEQMAANLSKCKRLQRDLEDAEDRAESITKTFLRASSVSRVADTFDSDYDSEHYSSSQTTTTSSSSTPSYMRASYLYSKPTSLDDYASSSSAPVRASSAVSWRSRFKTIDLDDDDVSVSSTSRYNKYSNIYNNMGSSCKYYFI